MALMWEPFSFTVFGDLTPSFQSEGSEISRFVLSSLRKLPDPLVKRINCVRFTSPIQNPIFAHWFGKENRSSTLATDHIVTELKRRYGSAHSLQIVYENSTPAWGPVDLRRHMEGSDKGEHARYLLTRVLDAHNLSDLEERKSLSRARWVRIPWCANGGPAFDTSRSLDVAVPRIPVERLIAAFRFYTEYPSKAWSETKTIRLKLTYRSHDPSARRHYPSGPGITEMSRRHRPSSGTAASAAIDAAKALTGVDSSAYVTLDPSTASWLARKAGQTVS